MEHVFDTLAEVYVPPGWPPEVLPPGSPDWESSAVAWLLDAVPADYRAYGVLRRHPLALARLARHHTNAAVEAARTGYRGAAVELKEHLPPHAIEDKYAPPRPSHPQARVNPDGVDITNPARLDAWLTGTPLAPTRTSHFAALRPAA
jgi:hypothetical protein